MKQITEPEMLRRAAAYCSVSERCVQDVQSKIEEAGLSTDVSEHIISRLLEDKFIDEDRFCRSFVNDKLRFNKWGRIKIAYELHRKGISPSIRNEALSNINEEEYRNILFTLLRDKKKSTKGKDDRDLFSKLLRFASGRGFESKESIQCLRQLLKDCDCADDME